MPFNLRHNEEKKPLVTIEGLFSQHSEFVSSRKEMEKSIDRNMGAIGKLVKEKFEKLAIAEHVSFNVIMMEPKIIVELYTSPELQKSMFSSTGFVPGYRWDGKLQKPEDILKENTENKIVGSSSIMLVYCTPLTELTEEKVSKIYQNVRKNIKILKKFKLPPKIPGTDTGMTPLGTIEAPETTVGFGVRTKYF